MSTEHGAVLLPIARAAIARKLGRPAQADTDADWLRQPGASFVTLTLGGALRGCIGSLQAQRPLLVDVETNACAAAFHDPRFSPLNASEFRHTRIEVSLLSERETLVFDTEQEALSQLRPGVDGVLFEYGFHRSTFLPQVWEQLPQPETFLSHLKLKAGLYADFWSRDVHLARYTVTQWQEPLPLAARNASNVPARRA